jgi:hypothetical protein
MAHGRVPIGDGAVKKAVVLRHANSRRVMPISPDKYEQVKKGNIQLKENNEVMLEENSVHRDLLMVTTFPLHVCISLLYGSMHHYVTTYNCRLRFKKW